MTRERGNEKARELLRVVSESISKGSFSEAERMLLEAKQKMVPTTSIQEQELILSELIELYCVTEPKNLAEAERLSIERETLMGTASARLQTAMLLYYSAGRYRETVRKAREAIELGRAQGDEKAVYTSLNLLGQSLLKLGDLSGAVAVLCEVETMVTSSRGFVIGDETSFLEALREQNIEADRVTHLASVLVGKCRNVIFRKKLETLAIKV